MSVKIRAWDFVSMRIVENDLLKPAGRRTPADLVNRPIDRTVLRLPFHTLGETYNISISYVGTFALLRIDVRNSTSSSRTVRVPIQRH
jgi:hypothetical protein